MRIKQEQLRQIIRRIIKESSWDDSSSYVGEHHPTSIYMDILQKGGPDHFCAIAHEQPSMKCTDFMHYEHALRAYIDTERPEYHSMPNNIFRFIVNLLQETV